LTERSALLPVGAVASTHHLFLFQSPKGDIASLGAVSTAEKPGDGWLLTNKCRNRRGGSVQASASGQKAPHLALNLACHAGDHLYQLIQYLTTL
jgi:hypothetical protein